MSGSLTAGLHIAAVLSANEPAAASDHDGNGRIDFADIVTPVGTM